MRRESVLVGIALTVGMFLSNPSQSQAVDAVEAKRIIATIVAQKMESFDATVLYLAVDFADPEVDLLDNISGLLPSGQNVRPLSDHLSDDEKIGVLKPGEAVALMFSELMGWQGSGKVSAYGIFCFDEASSSDFILKKRFKSWLVVDERRQGDAANCDQYYSIKKLALE